MSNSNNSSKTAQTGPIFTAKFVAANRGVQTEQRVSGRRAFPDRSGAQPKDGESWTVQVVGENPQRSVHFVKCLELVSAAPALEVVESKSVKPEQVKAAAPLMQVLRAPGNSVVARVSAWLSPTSAVDLSNLRFALAKRRIAGDTTASAMLNQLAATFEEAELQSEMVDIAARAIKSAGNNEAEVALALFVSRKAMVQLTADKAELMRETLDYARLVKQLKAQEKGQASTAAELAAQVSAVKEALDVKRAAHKEAMAAGKNALMDAEMGFHFSYYQSEVEDVIGHLTAKEASASKAEQLHTQLAAELEALEQHVSAVLC